MLGLLLIVLITVRLMLCSVSCLVSVTKCAVDKWYVTWGCDGTIA